MRQGWFALHFRLRFVRASDQTPPDYQTGRQILSLLMLPIFDRRLYKPQQHMRATGKNGSPILYLIRRSLEGQCWRQAP